MMLTAAIALGATLTGFGETVTNVRGSQRPNSNLVDIYYDLNATDGGTYTVEVAIEGRTDTVAATTFSVDIGKGVAPGKNRHIVWEAGIDWRGKKGDVKAVVTATKVHRETKDKHNKVQLWEGGPYWADRNIGADAPWKAGLYFWWGDTVGHRPKGTTFEFSFDWSNTPTYGKSFATLQSEGWIVSQNGTYVLTPSHDAAHVKWGGGWRMPTYQELGDLCNKCDWTWTMMNGVNGYVVRGRGVYVSNGIFLPCAGNCLGTSLYSFGLDGDYWSSVPNSDSDYSRDLYFGSSYHNTSDYGDRFYGFSVRPVQDFASPVSATGSSAWFFVDTTDGALKVSDVRSKYFDGEYGGVGRKATFLNGVSCNIEMTILDDPVNVDHWLVNGREVTTRTFTFDVGSLPVGGRLEVVAVGKNDGVRSKPFRANFDIAEHVDEEHAGLWMARSSNSKGFDEIRYTLMGTESMSIPLALERKATLPDKLKWISDKEWSICPTINLKPEVRSGGNGICTFATVGGKASRKLPNKFLGVFNKNIGASITGGPLALSWSPQKQKWVAEAVSFGAEVNGSFEADRHFLVPIGPVTVPVFGEVKLEAVAAFKIKVTGLNDGWGRLDSSFSLSSERLPKFTIGPGVGVNKKACIKIPVSASSVCNLSYNNGDWSDFRWGVRLSGALVAQLIGFDITVVEKTSDTWWIYNNTSPKSMRLMASTPTADIEWRLQSRDYLKKTIPRMRLMAIAPTDGVVESGGYPNPAPAIASGTAGDALAYLCDNFERTSANRTELVLRMGTSNEWSAVEVVWDDGTADFMPEVAALPDGMFVVAWANAGRTFTDDVTLPEMCGAMEIAVGVRNATTGAWSCRNLTADSVLDFAPVVRAGTNGTALVVWLRNAAGSLAGSAVEPTDIMASVYANGTWGAPAAVVAGAGSVSGFDVAFNGENAVLAFSKDADGDLQTMGDTEIFAVRFNGATWGEPTRLTYAGDSDGQPFVRGGVGTGFAVLWTKDGALMETTELAVSNAVAVAAADGWMLSGGCSVMRGVGGRDALVWGGDSEAGGAANAPVAMMYDPVCGVWGAPRKLLDDGRYERQLAGAVGADGGIRIGYESSSVSTNAEGEVIFGDVELRTRFIPAMCDLVVVEDGFSFASEDLTDGDETVLTVKVGNLGFRTATNAMVTVYEGVGDEKSELGNVVTNFPSGGIVAVNVPWTVDNTQSNLQFTVEIAAGENEDAGADSNNVYIWNAGAYDVSFAGVVVRNESATRRLLTAAVSNAGLGPLPNGGKVVFRRGGENGEVLAVDEIGTVWPGTNGVYNAGFAWDMEGVTFTSAWETVCVQLFPDGVTGSALDAADMSFVQVMTTLGAGDGTLFPPLGESATATDVESALSVGVDAGLTNITDVAMYEAFRQWVDTVMGVDGLTTAGAQAVKDSTRSWLSFALGADRLIGRELKSEDVTIESFTPSQEKGAFEMTVNVKDVDIGSGSIAEAVLKENLKKVLGIEGAKSLSSGTFSSDNIDITFDAPVDGKAKFTVTPPVDAGSSFFMRVKVK